ncbi:MAG TPA: amidohydrolase family protein [Candidatus Acidoferrales bacterium]|jgi:L-fuconolactonase
MIKIDSHQHFWRYNPTRDAWITDDMSILKRDFLPEELALECKANSIVASIAVQADQSEKETLFLLELVQDNPWIAGVVGWVDLSSANIEERLQFFSRYEKLRGFRHIAQAEPDDRFLMQLDFVRGISRLRQFGFAYDILIYPKQLPAAIELVSKFPEQRFVVDHLAKPEIKSQDLTFWETHIRRIAESPNVFCKLSGLVTEADWRNWKAADFKPYLDVVFDAFGADRLMFGSDWPVCLLAASYAQVKKLVEDYLRGCTALQKENIFGGNAIRFYNLKEFTNGLAA